MGGAIKPFTSSEEPITLQHIAERANVTKCKAHYHYRQRIRRRQATCQLNPSGILVKLNCDAANKVLKAIESANRERN